MKTTILFYFLILTQIALCQKKTYIQYDKAYNNGIELNFYKNKTELFFWIFDKSTKVNGDLLIDGNIYKCKLNFFQEINLKRIDNYRLLVLNKNLFFRQNEILYCWLYNDSVNYPIEKDMFWKKGLREGCWQKHVKNGIQFTEWKDGKKIKEYLKTHKQLEEDSKKFPHM